MAKVSTDGLGIELLGKSGNAVFVNTKNGIVLRPRITPKNPRTPAQIASRERFKKASALWKTLTPTQFAAWKAYGQAQKKALHLLFNGLCAKWYAVHPTGNPPLTPPAAPFFGDIIVVAAVGGSGKIVFTASAPNAPNVVTELLLQPLAHVNRAPILSRYRTQTFVAFATGNLTATVNVSPGAYACAVRFVNSLTGQEAGIQALGAASAL